MQSGRTGFWPGEGQFSGRLIVAEENVGNAFSFGAGQPGGNDCVDIVQHVVKEQRPAGNQNQYDRDVCLLQICESRLYPGRQVQVIPPIAEHLGVWRSPATTTPTLAPEAPVPSSENATLVFLETAC